MLHFWLKQILLCKAEVASPFVSSTHSDTGFKKKKGKEKKNCSHILLLNRLHLLYWQTLKYSYSSELQRFLICITLIIFQRREPDVTDYTPVLRWCKCYILLPLPLVPCCDPVGFPWQLQAPSRKSDWRIDLFFWISQIYAKNNGGLCPYWGYNTSN